MRHARFATASIAAMLAVSSFTADASPAKGEAKAAELPIPQSIRVEHESIYSALVRATHAPGKVGPAARHLAAVLHPHFVREEEIALPPLGLLGPLAAGDPLPDATLSAALAMSDSLKSELPRMREEHKKIGAAVEALRQAARADRAWKYERLAEQLALHARMEEEVLYPAAVLVGDLIRQRLQSR